MKKFNYEDLKREFNYGDLCGLDYLTDTIMEEIKNKLDSFITKQEDYILALFNATKEMNWVNQMYETEINVKAQDKASDLYFETRNLFLEELFNYLGIKKEIEDLWN